MNTPINHSLVQLDLSNPSGILNAIPESVGPRFETAVGGVIKASRSAGSMSFHTSVDFASIMLSPSPGMEAAFASDRTHQFNAPAGAVVINPADIDRTLRWLGMKKNVAVAFGRNAYAALAATELDGNKWDLRPPQFGHVDLRALRIGTAMARELSSAVINPVYLDALMTVLAVHIIRTYSAHKMTKPVMQTRLAGHHGKRIREYIHQNLAENLTILSMARIVQSSPSHFIRAFTLTFGMPPHQYLTKVRLEEAEALLTQTNLPIFEIAHRSGFSSQSHLTNTMKRLKNLTPGQIRATGNAGDAK